MGLQVTATGDVANAVAELRKLNATVEQVSAQLKKTQTATKDTGGATNQLTTAMSALGKALPWAVIAKTTLEIVRMGAQIQNSTNALNAFTAGNATEYIEAIQDATRGTVSEMQAMQAANTLLGMGLANTSSEVSEMVRVSAILGSTFRGLGAGEAAQEFATMLANMSVQRLDTFGISSGQVRARIEELKATVPGITQETAFMTAAMEIATAKADLLSGALEGQNGSVNRTQAALEDLKNTLIATLSNAVEPLVVGIADTTQAASNTVDTVEAMRTAWHQHLVELAATTDGYQEYVTEASELYEGLSMVEKALLGQQAALDVQANYRAIAIEAGVLAGQELYLHDQAILAARGIGQTTEATDEATLSTEEAAEQARAYEQALKDQLQTQQRLTSVVEDFGGQIGNLGVTVLRTTGANADMAGAQELLRDQIQQTTSDLNEARTAMIAFGDDGTGPIGAQVNELSTYLMHLNNRLNDVSGSAGGTTTAMTIASLTQEELQQVGESYLDFLKATGNELALSGQAYDDMRLKYGLVDETQIQLEHSMQQLGEALKNNNITVEQASTIYEQLVTGQMSSAEAAIFEANQVNVLSEALGVTQDKARGMAESMAQAYGIDPFAPMAGSVETLGESVNNATTPMGALQQQTDQIGQALTDITTMAEPAMGALAEAIPLAVTPLVLLSDKMLATTGNMRWMRDNSEAVFEALNEGAASATAEGAPLARANTLVAQMRAAWAFLLGNPNVSLHVYLTSSGNLQGSSGGEGSHATGGGAAGGGSFLTSGPTTLLVGDNPGGVERVDVTPLSGAGQTWVAPGSGLIAMAGGGSVVAEGMGGGNTYNTTVNVYQAVDTNDMIDELRRRGVVLVPSP